MDPRVVVTLVHGTRLDRIVGFGGDEPYAAAWCDESSPLCKGLRSALPSIRFRVFAWSGGNSHKERLRAASELVDFVRDSRETEPHAKHFIVAHSHGGNVVLYAMRDISQEIDGVVTLGTPFILTALRNHSESFDIMVLALPILALVIGSIATVIAFVASLFVVLQRFMADEMLLIVGLVLVQAVMVFGALLVVVLRRRVSAWAKGKLQTWVAMTATETVDRLTTPACADRPFLVVYAEQDEAAWWLQATERAGNMLHRLWSRSGYLALTFVAFLALVILFVTLDGSSDDIRELIGPAGLISMLVTIPTIAALALLHQAGMAVLPFVTRSHRFGFGGESIVDNWFVRISVSATPANMPAADLYKASNFGLGRTHVSLYNDPRTISRVVEWIEQKAEGC